MTRRKILGDIYINNHPIYKVWLGIKTRCFNPNAVNYKWYGAKGIGMCDEWRYNFLSFLSWAESNGYTKGLTIDRINPSSDYYPENCRWATMKQQNSTRRVPKKYKKS